ncbi:MAG: hypothetical protein L6R39_003562 [Caloplaca ligustica]|nr:MAG: hypothetical protein L6R39_003562 [Caloplaca ligustica]
MHRVVHLVQSIAARPTGTSPSQPTTLAKNLLDHVENTQARLEKLEMDVDRENKQATHFHRLYKDIESELDNERRQLFLDSIVQNHEHGGREAAQKLRKASIDYLNKHLQHLHRDVRILITVCCNLKGFSKTCSDAGIVDKPEDFARFVRDFNMGDPLCYFVDAGLGKECSDDKLREIFKLHIGQLQCKHIIFGGSADNGYARLLTPYIGDEVVRDRITLLEGPPFAGELAVLVNKFRTTSFPTVFRDAKIPNRRVSFSTTPPKSTSPHPPSWAATVQTRPAAELDSRPLREPTPPPENPKKPAILRNSKGQRVDPIIKVPNLLVVTMKQKKLCNNHYLGGYCPYVNCTHSHGEKLNDKAMAALRVVARMGPCSGGVYCDDEDCFSGHQCRREYCDTKSCRFPYDMHFVDQKVVNG